MFDPEIREYVKYLTMQYLRQVYYDKGPTWGWNINGICYEIREVIKKKTGLTDKELDEAEINHSMIQSVLNELVVDGYAKYHLKYEDNKSLNDWRKDYYYKLTEEGVDYIKGLQEPHKPIQFTVITGNQNSNIIAGDKNRQQN